MKTRKTSYIVHVDMDAFFAAIEQRDNPKYRLKPVVVGADPRSGRGRGVVSTASYEARLFGIHSAMPISTAYHRCPHAIFLPVDINKYERVSSGMYEIFDSFTPDIEPVGIDEAFLDMTGSAHLFGGPIAACRLMKSRIKEELGLTASVGLAPTKMAAKIASDLKKPDGLVAVTEEGLLDFLWPLDVRRIWGLGPKAEEELNAMGVRTIGDLARMDPDRLTGAFGRTGAYFWELANGIDCRSVCPDTEARSISNEHTFGEDTSDQSRIETCLMRLSEKVSARLREDELRCRTVTLKLRLRGFKTYLRSVTMAETTNFADILYKEAKALYNKFDRKGEPVRLIGIKASNIGMGEEIGLFSDGGGRQEKVHAAIDTIRGKFGYGYICRAASMRRGSKAKGRQANEEGGRRAGP